MTKKKVVSKQVKAQRTTKIELNQDEVTFLGAYKALRDSRDRAKKIRASKEYKNQQKSLEKLQAEMDKAIDVLESLMYSIEDNLYVDEDDEAGDW